MQYYCKQKPSYVIMEQVILNINDTSKLAFFIQLIKQLDFVEVAKVKTKEATAEYNFFDSAGLWAYREIDAKELRKQAWNRQK